MQLATQQLRLRNLTKIEGVNINADFKGNGNIRLYYTLHYSREESPFYISEALPKHIRQKWAEINCSEISKSNKNCVCVKVWLQEESHTENNGILESAKDANTSLPKVTHSFDDKMLFSWGVYFSGLTILEPNVDIQFNNNALIFQINGKHFSSASYFSISDVNDPPISTYKRGMYAENTMNSCSPDSVTLNSTNMNRSSSTSKKLLCTDCQADEVRRSYDLEKLLRMQDIQRQRIKRQRESNEIVGDIQQLCFHCITPDQLKRRGRSISYSSSKHHQNHAMGRKLTILLAEEDHVEPAELLHAQKLQRELETLHFRESLLAKEHKVLKERIADLQSRLSDISSERLAIQKTLELRVTELKKVEPLLEEKHEEHLQILQRRRLAVKNLENRRATLCAELQDIYPIRRNGNGLYTICDLPCPSLVNGSSSIATEQISPLVFNASLGYIAHFVKMISIIIDQPLRCPVMMNDTWIHYYTRNLNRSSTS